MQVRAVSNLSTLVHCAVKWTICWRTIQLNVVCHDYTEDTRALLG